MLYTSKKEVSNFIFKNKKYIIIRRRLCRLLHNVVTINNNNFLQFLMLITDKVIMTENVMTAGNVFI